MTRRTIIPVGCSARCGHERNPCQDWFTVADENNVIDVEASFAPSNRLAVLLKLLATVYISFVWAYEWSGEDHREFWFAYLSNWALSFSVVYTWLSLINSLLGVEQPRRHTDNVIGRVAAQWYMFNLAILASIFALVLWWVDVYESSETSINLMNLSVHGGTLFVLLLEGFVVNRIPIRWFFWWGTGLPFGLAYAGWTFIHSESEIGNPNDADSDLIYDAIDWKDDWGETLTLFLISILLFVPIVQSFLFCISIYGMPVCCGNNIRRYIDEEEGNDDPSNKSDITDL
jgi:hypothetical protein